MTDLQSPTPSLEPQSSTRPNPDFIRSLFSSISSDYDKANDVITFGLARRWRKKLVRWSQAKKGAKVLDCATGTGDLALDFKAHVGPEGQVIGTDFCEDMLKWAPLKAKEKGLDVQFEWADVLNLKYPSEHFDITSIAYGIRNVGDPLRALKEMARVTRSGGYVMVLETGDSQWPLFKNLYRFYFQHVVPRLGGLVTGHRSAYEYLNRSSNQFPAAEAFVHLMEKTEAFDQVEFIRLMGGASFIYRARKRAPLKPPTGEG